MKIASLIARILLGLIFLVFGLNNFLHFIPNPPVPALAGQFLGAMFVSHYLHVVAFLQIIGALLLLSNRYVPLAVVVLGPIVFNIVAFHVLLAPGGLPVALVTALLYIIVFFSVRSAFAGIFLQKA
jgi:putative oxidoreductase